MTPSSSSRRVSAGLWVLAFTAMVVFAGYQRRTGPTHPARGRGVAPNGVEIAWRLPRSETSGTEARVAVPDPGPGVEATLVWRRYPTADAFARVPMEAEDGWRRARLPTQPPAGKVEYHVELAQPGASTVALPPGGNAVLRYKGAVPAAVLVPHVLAMFLALVVGCRTILQASLGGRGLRGLAWATVILLALGGMVLGPVVQKYAFGAFWTGWPLGGDLTDTKTLVLFTGWLVAALALRPRVDASLGRRMLVLAVGLGTLAVYLVPHSLRGSTLDYTRTDAGTTPASAVVTGQ
ncbi:MAG: hypothetical protein JXB39_02785 [Deltaproteobacteria bacterium]|nr:hypothetical protein [Deltaproteobacteria bacterium]